METREDKIIDVLEAAILQIIETQTILQDFAAQYRAERDGAKAVNDHLTTLDIGGGRTFTGPKGFVERLIVETIRAPTLRDGQ